MDYKSRDGDIPEDDEEREEETPVEDALRNSIHVPVMVQVDAHLVKTDMCECYKVYRGETEIGTMIEVPEECFVAFRTNGGNATLTETIEEAVEWIVAG